MKVLIVGSGGREHAIAWKVAESNLVTALFCAPGNPGTASIAENIPLAIDDLEELTKFSVQEKIDLVIIGPEYPLTLGLADKLRAAGIKVFGPSKAAARIEGSKVFAKEIMLKAGVPTASYKDFTDKDKALAYVKQHSVPVVLKVDGLAAGKGVFVCTSKEQAEKAVDEAFDHIKADKVVVEEFIEGKEASFIVATNGKNCIPLAASHDYKRIFDGDQGPNTGGMGTVSPTPNLSASEEQWVIENIMQPVIDSMSESGCEFSGFLYAGLMISPKREIKILEFNARLGDPETQVILRRIESDFFKLLYDLADDQRPHIDPLKWSSGSAVCVVVASKGYPETSSKGDVITGLEQAGQKEGVIVFHAGTGINEDGAIVTAGGRVLNVTAVADSIAAARQNAYQAAEQISFDGAQKRSDIALES